MQRVEEEETKAKGLVEEAIKQRNNMDEYCKKIKAKIKENRENFKRQDSEFGFVFREENGEEEENKVALLDQLNSQRHSRASNVMTIVDGEESS